MNAAMGADAIMTQEELFFAVQRLRMYAVNKKLDMTDAFEEVRSAARQDISSGIFLLLLCLHHSTLTTHLCSLLSIAAPDTTRIWVSWTHSASSRFSDCSLAVS